MVVSGVRSSGRLQKGKIPPTLASVILRGVRPEPLLAWWSPLRLPHFSRKAPSLQRLSMERERSAGSTSVYSVRWRQEVLVAQVPNSRRQSESASAASPHIVPGDCQYLANRSGRVLIPSPLSGLRNRVTDPRNWYFGPFVGEKRRKGWLTRRSPPVVPTSPSTGLA